MRGNRIRATRAAAVGGLVAASLVLATPAAAATWSPPSPAAPPSSWNPGDALAVAGNVLLSTFAADCPLPGGGCASDRGRTMGVFVQRAGSDAARPAWKRPVRVSPRKVQAERATIAADGTRVVVGWVTQTSYLRYRASAPRVFQLRVSRDKGKTWGRVRSLTSASGRVDYPRVAIVGTRIYAVWTDAGSGAVRLARSTDAGTSWTKRTVGRTSSRAGAFAEGLSGTPDVGVAGWNVAVTWYRNAGGTQVVATSRRRGEDLGPGTTPTVLTASGPINGLRYASAAGATDGKSNRVAIAYTTGNALAVRVWDGSTLSGASVVSTWPETVAGSTYVDGYGPAVLPNGSDRLVVAVAGCRGGTGLSAPCSSTQKAARIDVLVASSPDDGASWRPFDRLTDAANAPYRVNDEPSVARTGTLNRVAFVRYQTSFTDYRVWMRSAA
jgi:hypothetical protein